MRKKIVRVVIVLIIIILMVILGINIFGFPGKYSRKDLVQLIDNADYSNVHYTIFDNGEKTLTVSIKGDTLIIETDKTLFWDSKDIGESVGLDKENKIAKKGTYKDMYPFYMEFVEHSLRWKTEKYKYVKEEIYNGKECIVFILGEGGRDERTMWIEKSTALILKIVADDEIREIDAILNYLTDDDVKRPDLTGYEIVYE